MARNPWFSEQCPSRGVLLHHTPDTLVMGDVCLHCKGSPPSRSVMPPIDVAARLKSLGLDRPMDEEPHSEDELVERKHITGTGPQGPKTGLGRGPLLALDKKRLTFYCLKVRAINDPLLDVVVD